jgi:hypothetical protein
MNDWGLVMHDPRGILSQAHGGGAPSGWAVFTKTRGRIGGFLKGTSNDPDPLLVITSEGIVEYVNHREGLHVVDFNELSEVTLRIRGRSFSDSTIVTLDLWLDLRFRDGRKHKWQSSSFADDYRTIQSVLEAYGAHKVIHGSP